MLLTTADCTKYIVQSRLDLTNKLDLTNFLLMTEFYVLKNLDLTNFWTIPRLDFNKLFIEKCVQANFRILAYTHRPLDFL